MNSETIPSAVLQLSFAGSVILRMAQEFLIWRDKRERYRLVRVHKVILSICY